MADETTYDEVFSMPSERYKTTVYFVILDAVITTISSRFSQSKEIMKDLGLFAPKRIMQYALHGLLDGISPKYLHKYKSTIESSIISDTGSSGDDEELSLSDDKIGDKLTVENIVQLLSKYGIALVSASPLLLLLLPPLLHCSI